MSGENDDAPTLLPADVPAQLSPGHPAHIGRYRLVRVLGEGGMGTVYEAVQDHPRRTVALKVVRGGLSSPLLARRFELEAELLGRLQHPGIAQVYEAGTADAGQGAGVQPYFAMELIRGASLTDFASQKGLGSRDRLALMARVCEAVDHAHARGVIHRDLKPSNILVDDTGQPKILDFGVARATDADVRVTTVETAVGQLVGTVAYMSPEQISADPAMIDGRSDVYALGVVTYELLTGRLPYVVHRRTMLDVAKAIRDENPTPLSSVNRVFRGDVETIVAKSLEKDRDRRYRSAAEFGEDLNRFLRDEPILARPAGTVYQLRKFARRNRVLVGGVFAVMAVLAVGAVVSTWQAIRATREGAKAKAVQDFVTTMLSSADPEQAHGEQATVRELIDSAAGRLKSSQLAGQPAVEGAVEATLAGAYGALGVYDQAREHGRRALLLLRGPEGGPNPGAGLDDLLHALMATGDADYRLNDNAAAEKTFREALDLSVRMNGTDAIETAQIRGRLGSYYVATGRNEEALPLLESAVASFRSHGEREALAGALMEQGLQYSTLANLERAEPPLREAIGLAREIWGPRHARVATASWLLGDTLAQKGAFDEAEPLLQDALSIRRQVYGPDHPHVALVLSSIALSRLYQGRFDESEGVYRQALEIRRKRFGRDHASVGASLKDLGWAQLQKGDAIAAVATMREAADTFRKALGPKSVELVSTLANIAIALQGMGDLPAAERAWDEALSAAKANYGDEHLEVAHTLLNMAGLYFPMGRVEDAERVTKDGLAMARRTAPPRDPVIAFGVNQMSFLLEERGAWGEALPLKLEGYDIAKGQRVAGSIENAADLTGLGEGYLHLKRYEDARGALEEAVALREKGLPAGDWRTSNSRSLLGEALAGLGRHAEAEAMLRSSAAALATAADAPAEVKRKAQERVAALRGG